MGVTRSAGSAYRCAQGLRATSLALPSQSRGPADTRTADPASIPHPFTIVPSLGLQRRGGAPGLERKMAGQAPTDDRRPRAPDRAKAISKRPPRGPTEVHGSQSADPATM